MDETTGGLAKLGEALAKAQGAMKAAKKDSTNPHFQSRYADLASIWDAIREPLASNGLSIIQRVTSAKDGVTVTTTLLHSSGESISDSCWLPVQQQTPQAFGSAITYGRRYSLASMVGVAADDDDGNAASGGPSSGRMAGVKAAAQAPKPTPPPSAPPPSKPTGTNGHGGVWPRVKAMLDEHELRGEPAMKFLETATGKTKRADLDEDDVGRIQSALAAEYPEPPPPGDGDAPAPT